MTHMTFPVVSAQGAIPYSYFTHSLRLVSQTGFNQSTLKLESHNAKITEYIVTEYSCCVGSVLRSGPRYTFPPERNDPLTDSRAHSTQLLSD